MRYLSLAKSGNWYFRFQIPAQHRHLFDNRFEVKQSLRTSNKQEAILKSLKLELEIRTSIQTNTPSLCNTPETTLITPEVVHPTPASRNPFKCLEEYKESKKEQVNPKTLNMAYAKCFTVLTLLNKKDIKEVRRMQAEEVRNLLGQYPLNARKNKQFDGLKGQQLIQANKTHKMPTLSPESVKDYIQKCSSFFEWCVKMEVTDINPFKGLKFRKTRKDSEAKNAYAESALKKLFSTEIHTQEKYKHHTTTGYHCWAY